MKKYLTAAGLMIVMAGCYNDNSEDLYPKEPISNCDTTNLTFNAKILPIFTQNCATVGCHSGSVPANGYDFSQYQGVKSSVTNGRLLGAIKHEQGYSPMPKNLPPLSDCDIKKIELWVNAGAINN